MEQIKLKDGTVYSIALGATENRVAVVIADITEFAGVYKAFTEANLESFSILNANGDTCATIKDKYVSGAVSAVDVEDGYHVVFNLLNVDLVLKRLKKLEKEKTETKDLVDMLVLELLEV